MIIIPVIDEEYRAGEISLLLLSFKDKHYVQLCTCHHFDDTVLSVSLKSAIPRKHYLSISIASNWQYLL